MLYPVGSLQDHPPSAPPFPFPATFPRGPQLGGFYPSGAHGSLQQVMAAATLRNCVEFVELSPVAR